MSNEKSGRFVGVSEHVGHALTFMILTNDTKKIIHWLVVQTATDPASKNLQATNPPASDPVQHIQSYIDDNAQDDDVPQPSMPIIHPEELIGRTIGMTQEDGQASQLRIIEAIKDHQNSVDNSSTNVKFRCSINDDAYKDILTYNQVMEYLSRDDDTDIIWKFQDIVGHQGPINKSHKDYKGSPYNLTVLWENGRPALNPFQSLQLMIQCHAQRTPNSTACLTYLDGSGLSP